MSGKIFYRYDGYEKLEAEEYISIKETAYTHVIFPKRYKNYIANGEIPEWLTFYTRRVFKNAKKSFAYSSKKEARNSFRIRKYRQIEHLTRQLGNAKAAHHQAEKEMFDDEAEYYISETLEIF